MSKLEHQTGFIYFQRVQKKEGFPFSEITVEDYQVAENNGSKRPWQSSAH